MLSVEDGIEHPFYRTDCRFCHVTDNFARDSYKIPANIGPGANLAGNAVPHGLRETFFDLFLVILFAVILESVVFFLIDMLG